MTTFRINLNLDRNTADSLFDAGFSLFGFKAVATPIANTEPLVWFSTRNYVTSTGIEYEQEYGAYTSTTEIIDGAQINATFNVPIQFDQTLVVNRENGTGDVEPGGFPTGISIQNQSGVQFTSGITQYNPDGVQTELCASPLFGPNLNQYTPIEMVMLTFATGRMVNGTVIERAFAPGALIDLTGAPNQTRDVTYELNSGWQEEVFLKMISPGQVLSDFLISNVESEGLSDAA